MRTSIVDPTRPEFQSTNLRTVSVLRLHKLATIHARSIVRTLGKLDPVSRRWSPPSCGSFWAWERVDAGEK
jgi:hypothetical protein